MLGKDGEVGLYVDEENTAYTNGDSDSNSIAVTIETSNSEVSSEYPVSDEVIRGNWGNGEERKSKLKKVGYFYTVKKWILWR